MVDSNSGGSNRAGAAKPSRVRESSAVLQGRLPHENSNSSSLDEVARSTASLVAAMMQFWKSAEGWAPRDEASLLSEAELAWQTSLAACLRRWTVPLTDGELILAWVNVGALIEGQLKLFLSVYLQDFRTDQPTSARTGREFSNPTDLTLEPLRVFFNSRVWMPSDHWDSWISTVQKRRNAIHAFRPREIGNTEELHSSLRTLRSFVYYMNSRLPYPDEASWLSAPNVGGLQGCCSS
jgi:hypothetical protein